MGEWGLGAGVKTREKAQGGAVEFLSAMTRGSRIHGGNGIRQRTGVIGPRSRDCDK